MCREKGLDAQAGDLFAHLRELPEESLDGIFCAHLIEHLPPARVPEMIRLCATRLTPGGAIAIETPDRRASPFSPRTSIWTPRTSARFRGSCWSST